jgi:serine/threonine protein kinase
MHLIKLLVTFEIRQVSDERPRSTFYFVFPWAEGDLWNFWSMHQNPEERIARCLWMAEQCYELAAALMYVHNERQVHLKALEDVMEDEYDLYGRHGDVKAGNVLYFEGRDILVMADFGLGRLHSKTSRSNEDPKTLEKTATYRAPEFDTVQGKISRASDIFSLGCMFLEFVTWYLLGWEALEEFPDYRLEKDRYDIQSDTFFRIEGDFGSLNRPAIKPKVVEWIRRLQRNPNCNQYILDFLDLIENKMLQPDATKRIKSGVLVKKLEFLARACRIDSSYFKEPLFYPEPDQT